MSNFFDDSLEAEFATFHVDELDGRAHEILIRRDEVEALDLSFEESPINWLVHDEEIVQTAARGILAETEGGGHVALGIAIDEESAALVRGEGSTEVYGRCRLPDPSFLIGNGNNPGQKAFSAKMNEI
jgi:hypothetical protein